MIEYPPRTIEPDAELGLHVADACAKCGYQFHWVGADRDYAVLRMNEIAQALHPTIDGQCRNDVHLHGKPELALFEGGPWWSVKRPSIVVYELGAAVETPVGRASVSAIDKVRGLVQLRTIHRA